MCIGKILQEGRQGRPSGSEATLINLDKAKAFDRIDHHFLEAVLAPTGFFFFFFTHFRSWIHIFIGSSSAMVVANGVRSKPLTLSRLPDLVLQVCVGGKLKMNTELPYLLLISRPAMPAT